MIEAILLFWFTEAGPDKWYIKDPEFDDLIRGRFEEIYDKAAAGEFDDWTNTAQGTLALVIVLDQFPRNMFRNTPKSFATDSKALAIAKEAVAKGFDKELPPEQRKFFYMPYMHSEALEDQEECVRLFDGTNEWAEKHRDVIVKFGRFPHRNEILGRESTQEEKEYLAAGGGF